MGGSISRASSGLKSPESYAQASAVAKKLPDEILKIMFATADFKDLLELSSIAGCGKYVFTTAKALSSLFHTLQVEPKEGAQGQIFFAPIQKLIPGVGVKEVDQDLKERLILRNNLCLKIAYYYIRIFQVYAALALTVMDTNPTRTMSVAETGRSLAKAQPKGPQAAIFTGGSVVQKGGELKTGQAKYGSKTAEVLLTDFKILQSWTDWVVKENQYFLRFTKTEEIQPQAFEFLIQWDYRPGVKHTDAEAIVKFKNTPFYPVTVKVNAVDTNRIDFYVGSTKITTFVKEPFNPWTPEEGYDDFYKELFETLSEMSLGAKAPAGAPAAAPAGAAAGVAGRVSTFGTTSALPGVIGSTATAFEKFKDVKDIFEKRVKGDSFPKAYAVGRAMILLNPIFEREKSKTTPFYSQICKRGYDFDPKDFLPRTGAQASANIYMKSLVALYYDQYQIVDNNVSFTQSETGATELRVASTQISKLFRVDKSQNTFVSTASVQYPQYDLCKVKGGDLLLQINDPKIVQRLQAVIAGLLNLQEEQTKQVNDLLKKMFIVKDNTMVFSNDLKKGGIEGVNRIAQVAREMLKIYYLKSEAFFTQGVLILEEMQNGVTGLRVA